MLLDRLFPRQLSAAEIERISQQLHRASVAPTLKTLSCLCESPSPEAVTNWLHWSVWQDKQNRQVWVHCSGGVAGVDVWYGPGDPSVAAELEPIPVPRGRAIMEDDGFSFRVSLHFRHGAYTAFVGIFLSAWLYGWFLAAMSAIRYLTTSAGALDVFFLIFWFAIWTAGGTAALFVLLWMLFGREFIELRPGAILHRHAILGIGPTKAYDLVHVKNLRLRSSDKPDLGCAADGWGLTGGSIVFDYGPSTVRCCALLDDAEPSPLRQWVVTAPRIRAEGAA